MDELSSVQDDQICTDTSSVAIANEDLSLNAVNAGIASCPLELSKHCSNTVDSDDDTLLQEGVAGTPIVTHDPRIPFVSSEIEHCPREVSSSLVEAASSEGGADFVHESKHLGMTHPRMLSSDSQIVTLRQNINQLEKVLGVSGEVKSDSSCLEIGDPLAFQATSNLSPVKDHGMWVFDRGLVEPSDTKDITYDGGHSI
ncbi:hypothetical protein Nepgr_024684 [Nepenthes gracilis]|uniref:Uncharacterized protein n=1 Tax=Nepenthes gracilis TaxID=150966 RepID=A0AAD3T577_NEPGR|nr:hypothetical protein Nepgr_024684 [Nepenthes gracilis]